MELSGSQTEESAIQAALPQELSTTPSSPPSTSINLNVEDELFQSLNSNMSASCSSALEITPKPRKRKQTDPAF